MIHHLSYYEIWVNEIKISLWDHTIELIVCDVLIKKVLTTKNVLFLDF